MKTQKRYYGIRFLGWSRTCTTGTPNVTTGRISRACDISVFRSASDRAEWINGEKLSASCGGGSGERIAATKKQCRNCCLGMSVQDFEDMLFSAEWMAYEN